MSRELKLSTKKTIAIKTQESVSIETEKISIDSVTDTGQSVTANISFFNSTGVTKTLTLWEGEDYTAIGRWTDKNVDDRIKILLAIT